MRIPGQGLDIRDAIVGGARGKGIVESVRGERGIPSGAAPADDQALGIRETLLRQPACARDRVLHVSDAPVAV